MNAAQEAKRDLVARRVSQADPTVPADVVVGAIAAVATNARTLDVLVSALEGGPEALGLGAPPSVGRLVSELRDRGSRLPEPRCAGCARTHRKLTASEDGAARCPRCRRLKLATACSVCRVVKPVAGRGPTGEALCARCAPRPRRACSRCGRIRPIARRAHGADGDVCDSCYKGPIATCGVCGRDKPCNFAAAGRPICVSCSPRRSRRCAHCGDQRPPCAQWPEGPVCEPCYRAALSRRGRCSDCHQDRRLMAPPGPDARRCADCAGVDPLAACHSCGIEDRLYADGECVRCALRTRAARLLGDPDGPLRPVYEAIVAAPQPYSAHNWLRSSAAAAVLGEIVAGTLALSHEGLDAHRRRRGADYLRHLLVAYGVLAPRDDELARLEAWVASRLDSVTDAARRRLLRSYATWRVLRRARSRAKAADPAARTPTGHARKTFNAAIAFLDFLERRDRVLADCAQADIDAWITEGPPNAPEVADFLDWAVDHYHVEHFPLPTPSRGPSPATVDDDARWEAARRFLHDDTIELSDRVAGCLVVLYAQHLSRIVTLRTDQIEKRPDGVVRLKLGATPIELPAPLDALTVRLATERRPYSGVGSPPATPWLFCGLDPGRPLTAYQLGQRLQRHGLRPSDARRAALTHLAGRLPAAMVARLLNITPNTAVRWVRTAGGDWSTYAAQLARRH